MPDTPLVGLGVLTGLCCGLCHSLCYLSSRFYVVHTRDSGLKLLLSAHVYMGLVCLPLTLLLWPAVWPSLRPVLLYTAGDVGFYVLGQWLMVESMRRCEPSRVSPLLGLKVMIMGVVMWMFFGAQLHAMQWVAVVLSTAGALGLGLSGGRLPVAAVATVLGAAVSYVFSDICIARLVNTFLSAGLPLLQASLFALALVYSLLALIALLVLPLRYGRAALRAHRRYAIPFAGFWLAAMAFFYTCLGIVGPVYGVVLQASRGILSVLLGVLVVRMGLLSMETRLPRHVFAQRLFAAVAMLLAIWLYGTHAVSS